jgi:hypothetical protein
MRSARSRAVAVLCLFLGARLPVGCESDWSSVRSGNGRSYESWNSGYRESNGDAGAVVLYAAVVVVAVVVKGTAQLITGIRDHFRDGGGGIAWDSAEGRRLRGD